jgi:lipopolysaccharide transport protein LptA
MNMRFPRLVMSCLLGLSASASALAADIAMQDRKLSADITDSNLRDDMHVLRGNVRISQGPMSIEADQATANSLQSGNSRWTFERSVHIQTEDADLKSNSASAAFSNGQLSQALVQGTPALFEHRRASDKQVKGRAGQIEYDLDSGTIKLTGQVWFSYGDNEFRGDTVIYNLREERVVVNPTGEKRGRVNITIRPEQRSGSSGGVSTGAPPAATNESDE